MLLIDMALMIKSFARLQHESRVGPEQSSGSDLVAFAVQVSRSREQAAFFQKHLIGFNRCPACSPQAQPLHCR